MLTYNLTMHSLYNSTVKCHKPTCKLVLITRHAIKPAPLACMISISHKVVKTLSTISNIKRSKEKVLGCVCWEWRWTAQLADWRSSSQTITNIGHDAGKLIWTYEKANEAREIEAKTNKQHAHDGDWQKAWLISFLLFKHKLNWLDGWEMLGSVLLPRWWQPINNAWLP